MPRLSPAEIAEKYQRNAQAASQDYVAGVERVTESPGRRAAANRGAYEAGVRDNADKWQARVGAVTTEDWKESVRANSANYASGISNKGAAKQERFWQEFGPHLDNVTAKVRSMPNDSPAAREARMIAQVRGVREFRNRRRG